MILDKKRVQVSEEEQLVPQPSLTVLTFLAFISVIALSVACYVCLPLYFETVAKVNSSYEDDTAAGPLKILVIHTILPDTRGGADRRLFNILTLLRAGGHDVHYLARDDWYNDESHKKIDGRLDALGIKVRKGYYTKDFATAEYFMEQEFEVVINLMWFWSGVSNNIPTDFIPFINTLPMPCRPVFVLIADDINYLVQRSLIPWDNDPIRKEAYRNRSLQMEEKELLSYNLNDIIFTVTAEDRKIVRERVPGKDVQVLSHSSSLQPSQIGAESRAPFHQRTDIVFIGGGTTITNRLSVGWFIRDVFPMVRKRLPGVKFKIAGLPPDETNWAGGDLSEPLPKGVHALAYVDNLHAFLNASRVFVAPIMMGTGINTKNTDGLVNGIPVVTTIKGTRGYGLDDRGRYRGRQVMLVGATAEDMVDQIVAVYSDQHLWEQVTANGIEFAQSHLSAKRLENDVKRATRHMAAVASASRARRCPVYSVPSTPP